MTFLRFQASYDLNSLIDLKNSYDFVDYLAFHCCKHKGSTLSSFLHPRRTLFLGILVFIDREAFDTSNTHIHIHHVNLLIRIMLKSTWDSVKMLSLRSHLN